MLAETMLAQLDLDAQVSLICAEVGIITRKGMSPAEAVVDAQRLVAWVNAGIASHRQFRLVTVALAMEHRVGGASVDKIMDVAQQLYTAMYPPKAVHVPKAKIISTPAAPKKKVSKKKVYR